MNLSDLMRRLGEIEKVLESRDDDALMQEWRTISLHASFLKPHNDSEVRFLMDRIEEYAELVGGVVILTRACEFERLQALDAIKRISDTLAEYAAQEQQQAAA